MQLVEGSVVAERFRLVRELGRGGMGSVWLAEHTGLDTLCAIKFIDKEGQNSPEMRQRFEREAKAAAQLKSPHVVQVHDHGVWEGVPYIAMEYLEGEDLAHRLERLGRLSRTDTCRIVSQVARALTKAHAGGIVHRDLKPENIFLIRDDDAEIAKVLDFGIAKRVRAVIDDSGTKAGSLLGTPFYMSPEQARGTRDVDHRSDLWALGVIAFQCLTGQVPFSSEGLGDILAQIMFEPLPVPSQRSANVPAAFDAWWGRACARPVEERFQNAREMADALVVALAVSQRVEGMPSIPQINIGPPLVSGFEVEESATALEEGLQAPLGAIATPTTPHPAALPGANTDNPFSVTYQEPRPARPKRALVLGAGFAAMAVIAIGIFTLRGRRAPARDRAAAQPDPMSLAAPPAPGVELPGPSVAPIEASPEAPALAPTALGAKSADPGAARAAATGSVHAAPPHAAKPPAAPAQPTRKRMDFGI